MYLLDTDILIYMIRGKYGIQERIYQTGLSNCAISEISLAELYVGVYKNGNEKSRAIVEYLKDTFTVIPVSTALETFGKLRANLDCQGLRLDKNDLFIASTALANGYTLITHNNRHFSRIPDLKLEDWVPSSGQEQPAC